MTPMKEKMVLGKKIQTTSPFGDPAPERLISTIPSENHLPWGRVAKPPL
jgi:hypothetical protein